MLPLYDLQILLKKGVIYRPTVVVLGRDVAVYQKIFSHSILKKYK
jgi:hypothetical protein